MNLAFLLGRGPPGGPGLRRLVPAYALRSVGLLDLFSGVLLPAVGASDRGDWHFLRLGEATGRQERWSPLQQLGRTSLFIYWIHVEMVYGLLSLPLHHALTLRQAWLALALFSLFMLFCSIGKDRLVARRETRREPNRGVFLPSSHPPCDSL